MSFKQEHGEISSKYALCDFKDLRPFLDAIDRLRAMSVTEEGISLPTIVVVGDQSHGKSSVLESLAGVDLPRGTGVVTRVPLELRLQDSKDGEVTIHIQYGGQKYRIDEDDISSAIESATNELAGTGKGIVNAPISLHIKKPGAPDLTMVDLPGITRVPIDGQPEDISEQISRMILEYIKPEDSIILNVVQASVDFSTCESISMSRRVDKTGERTLVVVTKVDKSPENLHYKVSAAAASIGLGYVCVRNRTPDDDSYEEARHKEAMLFATHPDLKKFDKGMAGIPSLAKQLTNIQRESIRKSLPKMIRKVESDLSSKKKDLARMPQRADDMKSASTTYLRISRALRRVMENLLDGKFTDYPNDKNMHLSARCHEMYTKFSNQLLHGEWDDIEDLLAESRGINLPNFLESSVFQHLIAEAISHITAPCFKLVSDVHVYTSGASESVIDKHTSGYPRLRSLFKCKMQDVLAKSRECCESFVTRKLEKERTIIYTYQNEQYTSNLAAAAVEGTPEGTPAKTCEGMEAVKEMNHSLEAYWEVVKCRLADEIPLEIRFGLLDAIIKEWEEQTGIVPGNIVELMAEDPQLHHKRDRLQHSIGVLEKCYSVVMEVASPSGF